MKKTRVLIADDHTMSRQLLELYIHASARYELAASVSDPAELAGLCRDHRPDLILMDVVTRSGAGGLEIAGQLKRSRPGIRIIIVTDVPEYSYPARAKELGVDSFWYKEGQRPPILTVMDRTMAGESVYPESAPEVRIGLAAGGDFTNRERDVLRELVEGHNNRTIAGKLGISEHAVHYHINNMLSKTGYTNRTKLAVMVRKCGFVINAKEERPMK